MYLVNALKNAEVSLIYLKPQSLDYTEIFGLSINSICAQVFGFWLNNGNTLFHKHWHIAVLSSGQKLQRWPENWFVFHDSSFHEFLKIWPSHEELIQPFPDPQLFLFHFSKLNSLTTQILAEGEGPFLLVTQQVRFWHNMTWSREIYISWWHFHCMALSTNVQGLHLEQL